MVILQCDVPAPYRADSVIAVDLAATVAKKQSKKRGSRSFKESTAKVVAGNSADTNGDTVVAQKLPPEIRLRIYELVLTIPHNHLSTRPHWGLPYVFKGPGPKCTDLSLLCVSRQTFLEAFHVFYRYNKLHFESTDMLYKFLKNIGYLRRQQITSIAFGWLWIDLYAKEAFRLLKTCPNLKHMDIIVNSKTYPRWTMPNEAALKEVRGMETVEFLAHWPWKPSYRRRYSEGGIVGDIKQAMLRPRLKRYAVNPTKLVYPFKEQNERFRKCEGTLLKDEFRRALEDAKDFEGAVEFMEDRSDELVIRARHNLIPTFRS